MIVEHIREVTRRMHDAFPPQHRKMLEDSNELQRAELAIFANLERTDFSGLNAIVVAGSTMDYYPGRGRLKTGRWEFNTIVQNGIGGLDGGKSKTLAARQLVDEGYQGLFIITGGQEDHPIVGKASKSDELARVLVEERQIPQSQVISIGTEGNTLGNVRDAVRFLTEHTEVLQHRRIGILTNEWHIFRVLLMFNQAAFFKEQQIEIIPIVVDDVLLRRSTHYRRWLTTVEATAEMETRISLEASGISDFLNGTYQVRHGGIDT